MRLDHGVMLLGVLVGLGGCGFLPWQQQAKPTVPVTGAISPGSVIVRENRLHFAAKVWGAELPQIGAYDEKQPSPVKAELRGPNGFRREIDVRDSAGSSRCEGAQPERNGELDFHDECSVEVAGAPLGRYTLSLRHGGKVITAHAFTMVHEPTVRGETFLSTAFAERVNRVDLDSRTIFWHRNDARVQVELITLAWLRAGEVIAIGNDATLGNPRLEYGQRMTDVYPVVVPGLPADALKRADAPLRLLALRNQGELIASFTVTPAQARAWSTTSWLQLEAGDAPSPDELAAAQARTAALYATDSEHGVDRLGVRYTEQLICAIASDVEARRLFFEAQRTRNAGQWEFYDMAVAHDAALDPRVSDKQRKQLKQRMSQKAHAQMQSKKIARKLEDALSRALKAQKPGCIEAARQQAQSLPATPPSSAR